ncbi:amidohydrolase, partial [Dehalococcoidia bacterium]|nr:amidohydrolase [Dehalococcoidia bacterium]
MPAVTNNNGSGPWSADLLLNHAGIITMDAQRRVLRDGSIAVAEGRIVAVGPSTEVAPMVRATEIRDLKGALVHPGFIDAHVHPTLQLVRGVLPDFYEEERMVREYGPPSAAEKTEEEEYSSVLL